MSAVPVRPLVVIFRNSKEAKRVAEKYWAKSFKNYVILDVNLEENYLEEIVTSLKQAGAKKIYFPHRHRELVIPACSENEVEEAIFPHLYYQELIINVYLPKDVPLEMLPLTNSPELAKTVRLLVDCCGKPEITVGRKRAKRTFKYAGSPIYCRTYRRSQGQFYFDSLHDKTVIDVPQQKEVKVKILKEIH
jgi:hypothetical protein